MSPRICKCPSEIQVESGRFTQVYLYNLDIHTINHILCVFQLRLTKANDHLEIEKRELAVLLEKRNIEIDRLNGNITTIHLDTSTEVQINRGVEIVKFSTCPWTSKWP